MGQLVQSLFLGKTLVERSIIERLIVRSDLVFETG